MSVDHTDGCNKANQRVGEMSIKHTLLMPKGSVIDKWKHLCEHLSGHGVELNQLLLVYSFIQCGSIYILDSKVFWSPNIYWPTASQFHANEIHRWYTLHINVYSGLLLVSSQKCCWKLYLVGNWLTTESVGSSQLLIFSKYLIIIKCKFTKCFINETKYTIQIQY